MNTTKEPEKVIAAFKQIERKLKSEKINQNISQSNYRRNKINNLIVFIERKKANS